MSMSSWPGRSAGWTASSAGGSATMSQPVASVHALEPEDVAEEAAHRLGGRAVEDDVDTAEHGRVSERGSARIQRMRSLIQVARS